MKSALKTLKFGVFPPYGMAPIEDPEYAIAFAKLAEEFGFESIWVVEHVVMLVEYESVYPYDPSGRSPFSSDVAQPDPLIWLSHIAATTKRIRLATGVLVLPQRNPLILAKELASLDRLSGGRLEIGIGMGWVKEEADALGTCFENRGRRADEYIDVMRTLWREPVANFNGEFVRFRGAVSRPKPVQAGGVPIVIGGHSHSAAKRAGRVGDGFFPLGVAPNKLASLCETMRASANAHGRDPAKIEITCVGLPDLASAEFYAERNVGRVVVSPKHRELSEIRKFFEEFKKNVMEKF